MDHLRTKKIKRTKPRTNTGDGVRSYDRQVFIQNFINKTRDRLTPGLDSMSRQIINNNLNIDSPMYDLSLQLSHLLSTQPAQGYFMTRSAELLIPSDWQTQLRTLSTIYLEDENSQINVYSEAMPRVNRTLNSFPTPSPFVKSMRNIQGDISQLSADIESTLHSNSDTDVTISRRFEVGPEIMIAAQLAGSFVSERNQALLRTLYESRKKQDGTIESLGDVIFVSPPNQLAMIVYDTEHLRTKKIKRNVKPGDKSDP